MGRPEKYDIKVEIFSRLNKKLPVDPTRCGLRNSASTDVSRNFPFHYPVRMMGELVVTVDTKYIRCQGKERKEREEVSFPNAEEIT